MTGEAAIVMAGYYENGSQGEVRACGARLGARGRNPGKDLRPEGGRAYAAIRRRIENGNFG